MNTHSKLVRPRPPASLLRSLRDEIVPAPEVVTWLRAAFVSGNFKTKNPDHSHLQDATLGVLWTNIECRIGGCRVAGFAEMPSVTGNLWKRARHDEQLIQWFGTVPTFLITLDADISDSRDDISFCALVEHELYHCGQRLDEFGCPKFSRSTGKPVFGMRSHDVEEFVPIHRRYGIWACAGQSVAFVEAAKFPPLLGYADLGGVCGTCHR